MSDPHEDPRRTAYVVDIEREVERLKAEIAGLKAEVETLYAQTYCAYCGQMFKLEQPNTAELVGEHIRVCPKHPMRRLEEEMHQLRYALTNCVLAMRLWGAEEDGIPEDGPIAAAYENANALLAGYAVKEKP